MRSLTSLRCFVVAAAGLVTVAACTLPPLTGGPCLSAANCLDGQWCAPPGDGGVTFGTCVESVELEARVVSTGTTGGPVKIQVGSCPQTHAAVPTLGGNYVLDEGCAEPGRVEATFAALAAGCPVQAASWEGYVAAAMNVSPKRIDRVVALEVNGAFLITPGAGGCGLSECALSADNGGGTSVRCAPSEGGCACGVWTHSEEATSGTWKYNSTDAGEVLTVNTGAALEGYRVEEDGRGVWLQRVYLTGETGARLHFTPQ